MTSITLRTQSVSPRTAKLNTEATVKKAEWSAQTRDGSPEVEVELSDGNAIRLRWQGTYSYVWAQVAAPDAGEWSDVPLSSALAMSSEVEALVGELVERAERWSEEERASDMGAGSES